jgi:hypothetical protein
LSKILKMSSKPEEERVSPATPASGVWRIPMIVASAANGIASKNYSSLSGNSVTTLENTVDLQGPQDITAPNTAAPTPRLVLPALRLSRTSSKRTREENSYATTAMGRKQANVVTIGNKRHRGRRIIDDSDNSGDAPKLSAGEAKAEPKPAVTVPRENRGIITSNNDISAGALEPVLTEPRSEPTPAVPQRSLRIVINRGSHGDGRLRAAVTGPAETEPTVTEGSGGNLTPSLAAMPPAGSTLAKVAGCLA